MKKSKRLPSRIKYENSHPTVSARLSIEQHEKLLALLKSTKTTLPQLLLHFIGEYEPKVTPVEAARKQGYREGYRDGFTRGEEVFSVKYSCVKCGKEITVNSTEEKTYIRKMMRQNGWQHTDCNDAV